MLVLFYCSLKYFPNCLSKGLPTPQENTIHTLRNAQSLGVSVGHTVAGALSQPVCAVRPWPNDYYSSASVSSSITQGKGAQWRLKATVPHYAYSTPGIWWAVQKQRLFWCRMRCAVGHSRLHRPARAPGESFRAPLFFPSQCSTVIDFTPSLPLLPEFWSPGRDSSFRLLMAIPFSQFFLHSFHQSFSAKAFPESMQNPFTSQSSPCSFWCWYALCISSATISLKSMHPSGQKSMRSGWVHI